MTKFAVMLVHGHSLTWLSEIINGVEPSLTLLVTLVLFLLRQATMSGGESVYKTGNMTSPSSPENGLLR